MLVNLINKHGVVPKKNFPGHVELGGEQTAMRTPQLIRESNRFIQHTSHTHLRSSIVHWDCTRMFCS